jgi:hypothetical protein
MTPEEQLEQELFSLTPEELDQYESELRSTQEPKYAPGQTHVIDSETGRTVAIPEEDVTPEISGADALLLGIQEGVPFAKDAEAATRALLDTGASFDESYSRNMDEINEAMNEAEDKHPIAFNMGDFGASFAIPAAKGYKAAMTLGALSGISRSEDRDVWDAISGGALGAVGLKLGEKAASGINIVGKKLGLISDDTTKEILVRSGSVEDVNAHIRKWFMDEGDDLSAGTAKFAKHLLGRKAGKDKLITGKDVPESIYRKASDLSSVLGKQIDDVVSEVDYKLPANEVSNVFNWIKKRAGVDDMLESSSPTAQEQGKKLLNKLKSEFFEETGDFVEVKSSQIIGDKVETMVESVPKIVPRKLNLKDLVSMKRAYADMSNIKHLNGQAIPGSDNVEFWGNVTKSMSAIIPELAENTGKLDKTAFRALNKDFATAKLVERSTKNLADKEKSGMLGKLRHLLQYKSMVLTTSMVAGATMGGAPAAVIAGTASLLTGLAADPAAPQKFAIGLRKLSNNLQNPNYSRYIQKLGVASTISTDTFRNSLSNIASKLYLEENPIRRTKDSAIENSQEILNILTDELPNLAPQFRKAIENNDDATIGSIMEQLSDNESSSQFIEQGTGWDGKVYSPEKKAELANEVERMDISRLQKSKLKKSLFQEGLVPQIQQEPGRFFKYQTRDKKRPQF